MHCESVFAWAKKKSKMHPILKFCTHLNYALGHLVSTGHWQSSLHPAPTHNVFLWFKIQPRNLEAFTFSSTSIVQSHSFPFHKKRKAVLQSGQQYPDCWAKSFEFHFAVGSWRCSGACSSLGHHRGDGSTAVHTMKLIIERLPWEYTVFSFLS